MQLKKILFIALVTLTFFSFSQKIKLVNKWLYACSSTAGDRYWIESATIGNHSPYVKVWTMTTYKKFEWKNKIYYNAEGKVLREYDCSGHRSRDYTAVYYDSHNRLIALINLKDFEIEWDDIVPDTVHEGLLNKVCSTFSNNQ